MTSITNDIVTLYKSTILFKARGVDYFVCMFFENEREYDIFGIVRDEFARVEEFYNPPMTLRNIFCLELDKELPMFELTEIREDPDPFYAIKVADDKYLFLNGNRDALDGITIHGGAVTPIPEYQLSYKKDVVSDAYIFRDEYTYEDIIERFRERFIPGLKRSLCII